MDDAQEIERRLREAVAMMPATIESGTLNPNASATARLQWVELATRVYRGPVGRPTTDIDIENQLKTARILKAVVPELEKIRDEHQSESLSSSAARYLQFISDHVRA